MYPFATTFNSSPLIIHSVKQPKGLHMEAKDLEKMMTTKEVSKYLRISEAALYEYRRTGTGPNYVRLNDRLVRYRKSDVDEWLNAKKIETK